MGVNDELARIAAEKVEADARSARVNADAVRREDLLKRYAKWLIDNSFPFTGHDYATHTVTEKVGWFRTKTRTVTTKGAGFWYVEGTSAFYSGDFENGVSESIDWFIKVYEDGKIEEKVGFAVTGPSLAGRIAKMVEQLRHKGVNAVWPYDD